MPHISLGGQSHHTIARCKLSTVAIDDRDVIISADKLLILVQSQPLGKSRGSFRGELFGRLERLLQLDINTSLGFPPIQDRIVSNVDVEIDPIPFFIGDSLAVVQCVDFVTEPFKPGPSPTKLNLLDRLRAVRFENEGPNQTPLARRRNRLSWPTVIVDPGLPVILPQSLLVGIG
jgi:hypothetical protein